LIPIKRVKIIDLAIYMAVFAGQYCTTTWRTYRIGHKTTRKQCPFSGNPIYVWGLIELMAISAYRLIGMIVTKNKYNIRRWVVVGLFRIRLTTE